MRILTRYVLREFLIPLTYCLLGFLGIYMLFDLSSEFRRISESGASAGQVAAYFFGYVSPYLEWIIPAALLLATLYTMWNFCRHSEITAMRASGIGFFAIVRPLLAVAAVAALLVAYINEFYAPHAAEWARDFRENRYSSERTGTKEGRLPYYNRLARRVWRINRFSPDTPDVLHGLQLSFSRPDGSRELDIATHKAEYLDGMWWFHHPQYKYFDELDTPTTNPAPETATLSIRAFPELDETPRDFILMNKEWNYYTVRDMTHFLREHPTLEKTDRASRTYDIHARVAAPFSCLIITLFAIPAGIATGRQSVFKGVMIAIAMFFGFYALSILCMILAKRAFIPAVLAAWLPNVLFTAAGIILFRRQR